MNSLYPSIPAKLTLSFAGHGPYLTSVRKEASSHLVVSLIWLKSPSQIRGIKPESPCNGKEERQQLSLEIKATGDAICSFGVDTDSRGLHNHPRSTSRGPRHTIYPTPPGLLPTLWNESIELSNFHMLRNI